ncbi:MAG: TM2 domain-containing protein [Cetobacterium sp.]|uniref:TM2 domain-containing protein n=1 Tax=Cetobacterium ceti TaxID=180163 RepID=A0A1T4NVS8_9FUSO|nr:TM2 domain-containing protein [Cetobacterium ceti]MCJ8341261.1 TM2 domain-containing protein [Cetobacterium sp.]SJZ82848.1 TM2 domain-containing protein [Cetobacterium ceti]
MSYYNDNVGKDWLITLILAIFLGMFGVHRFYVGKTGTGILQLITGGGFGIWYLIDIFMILIGSFTDANGNRLVKH